MNLGRFSSPPKATRTVEMSNHRVTIINPLSLPASSGVGSLSAMPNSLQQSYNESANDTQKATTSGKLTLEPLTSSSSSEVAGTSTDTGTRVEFPSSVLDLYTTILQDLEHSSDDQNLDKSQPLKDQVQTSANSEQSISSHGIGSKMSEYGDYIPTLTGQSHRSISADRLSAEVSSEDVCRLEPSAEVPGHSISAMDLCDLGSKTTVVKKETSSVDSLLNSVDTLPEVVENVSQAQRHQLLEVTRQQEILQKVKDQLAAEKEEEDELVVELSACKRNICLTEDKGAKLQKQCKQFEKDMINAMAEDFKMCKKCRDEDESLAENKRLYERYRCKMSEHRRAVAEVEATMDINVEVKRQQQIIASLHAEKAAMESKFKEGSSGKLQQDICAFTAEKEMFQHKINQQKSEMKMESSKQNAINQDIDVLHKRNQAQLKRLKKQLKEAHLRNRQWNEEACRLERHLEELKKTMEE